jgi:hypothetical protein
MTEEIKPWNTKRGGAGIIHDHFIYNYHCNKNKNTRWRCHNRLCSGALFTDIETVYILERRDHQHGPETNLEKGIIIKKYTYDEKKSIDVPFKNIIIVALQVIDENDLKDIDLPFYDSLRDVSVRKRPAFLKGVWHFNMMCRHI